jgi:Molecular chaperone
MMNEKVFGIDLGTTYSAVAHVDEFGNASVIQNLEGDSTTPSVVFFESPDDFVVGKVAKNGAKVFPDDTISLVKRIMGSSRKLTFQGKEYTPEAISALILRQLLEAAREMVGSDSNKAVITVPAYFGLAEKEATRIAGEIAGVDVVGILAEPIAAALSVGLKPGHPQTVFVYDLGGGTFDCTVMELGDEGVTVLAVDGDRQLGGADWDSRLFNLVLEKFRAEAALDEDPSLDDEFYQDLLSSVEDAKRLSL